MPATLMSAYPQSLCTRPSNAGPAAKLQTAGVGWRIKDINYHDMIVWQLRAETWRPSSCSSSQASIFTWTRAQSFSLMMVGPTLADTRYFNFDSSSSQQTLTCASWAPAAAWNCSGRNLIRLRSVFGSGLVFCRRTFASAQNKRHVRLSLIRLSWK